MFSKLFSFLQKVGQSLMIPVSVLPAAGLLVALGRVLKDNSQAANWLHTTGEIFYSGGLALFEQLPLIFAMGVAIGFSSGAGVAALAAGAGYFAFANVLKVLSTLQNSGLNINTGVFGGILVGALSAWLYNRYHKTQLHPILGFFSGKRLVPILAAASSLVLALALGVVWPPIQTGIHSLGVLAMDSSIGPAVYAAGKRLLIPVGLHHVYYPPFLYEFGEFITQAGATVKGDTTRYFAGDPSAGKFMASEFPIMLFGLPMAALAMVLRARPDRRKAVGGMMLSAALTSIITGITEPIEFAFIFVAPILYVLHVSLAFVSGLLTNALDIHLGYTFSASLIDFVVGYFNQKNSMSLWLIVGPIMGLLYFFGFYTLIGVLNLKTTGREVSEESNHDSELRVEQKDDVRIRSILAALGGVNNIKSLDACITRLRLTVEDTSLVNPAELKKLGAAGTMISGHSVQIVFGVTSEEIKDQLKQVMSTQIFYSPIAGEILNLSEVPDETFSQKVLGDGFAILPQSGLVKAPCDATVFHVFPTGHALALKTDQDLEILIHVGIDTVNMKGEGFRLLVKPGQKVRKNDPLLEFDLNLVKQKAKSTITPVVITNMDRVRSFNLNTQAQTHEPVVQITI